MRAGGSCAAVQQSLTAEAAGVVKQAVVLARRRGHAQVTPLHVANTMLAAPSGLFRVACLESHSHPLQCKALELCFNVALNRLPASSSSSSSNPMVGPHSPTPSISNALVAAFKRAQAHQRRGSVDAQQPPLLAVKIELDQLVISILDDPSVSRVMREAGFSSTQVKSNVEKAVSNLELNITSSKSKDNNTLMIMANNQLEEKTLEPNEDVKVVIEALTRNIRKRKSVVLVGESISSLETTIRVLMDRVDRGDVPEGLKEVKFISIPPLYSFCNLHREEVELKIRELTCLVKSLVGKGVVLYLGDLKWISDYKVSLEHERSSYYCSVEHMIMEIGRLVWGIGEIERFWLMGIATFQSYMRCRNGYHSLESLWGLHPLTIPANTLGFSLVSHSDDQKGDDRHKQLSSCNECSAEFEAEARNLQTSVCNSSNNEPTLSSLPFWLKTESTRVKDNDQNCGAIKQVWKKWNTFCMSAHKQPQSLQGTLTTFSSSSFSLEKQNLDQSAPTHFQFLETTTSNPSSTLNSASSSDNNIMDMEYTQRFKEFNAENLNILCNALEDKVPSQREIIPEIAGTILQCRSGMLRRRDNHHHNTKEETWLFFLGRDEAQAKEKISRELAKAVFGSYSSFVSIGLSSFVVSPTRDDCRNKRGRDDDKSYMDRFSEAVSENPHRVFLLEDLDQADHCSQLGIKMAIERGRILGNENGEEIGLKDAVIVLSCESFRSRSRGSSPSPAMQESENGTAGAGGDGEGGNSVLLDLNISFDDQSSHVDDLGILENVDRRLVFKSHHL